MGTDLLPLETAEKPGMPLKWTGVHRRIVALEVAGYKAQQIAAMLGMNRTYVCRIINDPRADVDRKQFAEKVVNAVGDVQLKIALHADEALEEILDEMRVCEDVKVRQKAAFGILDRAGYTPVRKEIVAHTTIPSEMLSGMQSVMDEMKGIQEIDYTIVEEAAEVVDGD